jgi:hypothetical protein
MNRFLSGAAGAIVAAAWMSVAHAGLEPLTLSRILELEVSITASHARTFAWAGDWRDAERSLVDDSKDPIGRAPGGFVQAFGAPDGDLVRFGWVSPVAGKFARGQGTLILRLLAAARIEEVLADSAIVSFTAGGRTIAAGTLLDRGIHRISWSLDGTAPSEAYGGGLRLVAASSTVPLPAALPAAALLLGGSLRRRRRAA